MVGCLTCALAKWDRTSNGRLHPSGKGRCTFVPEPGPLPPWANDLRALMARYRGGPAPSIWREEGANAECEAQQPAKEG